MKRICITHVRDEECSQLEGKAHLGDPAAGGDDKIKLNLKETGYGVVEELRMTFNGELL
jgi:hypothetical protein